MICHLAFRRISLSSRSIVVLLAACSIFCLTCYGQANVLTYHNDNARTSHNVSETILTPPVVNSSTFGKLFTVPVDGKVTAQPLYVSAIVISGNNPRNLVYVVTEHDSVYAFDADTGTVYWNISVLGSGETPSDDRGCWQISPEIGIPGTPVIDMSIGTHGTMYLLAMSKDVLGNYHHRLHAVDITTGAEEFGGPVEIQATYPGTGDNSSGGNVIFDPKQYRSRPGLLVVNGTLFTAWGSHCDTRPYTGWVMAYDELTLRQIAVFNFAPNGNGGSIWASGCGMAADTSGNIYAEVGNGTFDTTLNAQGFPSGGDYGSALVKLALSGGQLQVTDYWAVSDVTYLNNQDLDFGSSGPLLLPDLTDLFGNVHHLGLAGSKDVNIYVFDRDNLGKFDSFGNGTLYQELPAALTAGQWASPAWFNGTAYYSAEGDVIKAFTMNALSLLLTSSSMTPNSFPYPGATPAISANGTSSGILWALENNTPAVLHAYDASNLSTELYNSNQATAGRDQFGTIEHFVTPTIANGKVFVATDNSIAVFGLLNAVQAEVSPSSIDFAYQTVGISSTASTLKIMNSSTLPLAITNISVAGPNGSEFISSNNCGASVPVGTTCTVSIIFRPAGTGSRSASVIVSTNAVNSPEFVALSGVGGAATTITAANASATMSASAQPIQLSAAVTSTVGTVNSGTVTFSVFDGNTLIGSSVASGTVSNGNASATYTLPAGTPAGSYALHALYNGAGSLNPSSDTAHTLTVAAATLLQPLVLVPVTPCRILDTRNGDNALGGPEMGAATARSFPVQSSNCNIPANAMAYWFNVTVVPDGPLAYLTIWPTGQGQPLVSTLNSDGRIKAVSAIVPAGMHGAVSVYVTNPTHVILDLNGYFVPSTNGPTLSFYPLTPCRLVDTRFGTGALAGPSLTGGTSRSFPLISSSCGVPSSAQAYSLNFTAVPKGNSLGWITVWPTGQAEPLASTLNAPTGAITANAAVVSAGNSGEVSVFATDNTDLIIDINGYFAPPKPGGLSLYNVPPCRVVDTRSSSGQFNGTLRVNVVETACGAPASSAAFVLNATVVPPGGLTYLTLWPDGQLQPLVSTLNALDGAITSNLAIVPSNNGSIDAFGSNPTQLVLDIAGYFAP